MKAPPARSGLFFAVALAFGTVPEQVRRVYRYNCCIAIF